MFVELISLYFTELNNLNFFFLVLRNLSNCCRSNGWWLLIHVFQVCYFVWRWCLFHFLVRSIGLHLCLWLLSNFHEPFWQYVIDLSLMWFSMLSASSNSASMKSWNIVSISPVSLIFSKWSLTLSTRSKALRLVCLDLFASDYLSCDSNSFRFFVTCPFK